MSNPERDKLLADLGLDKDQIGRFYNNLLVVYALNTQTAPGIGLIHWVAPNQLRSGIVEVNDPGNGLRTFGRFRTRTINLAARMGMSQVEIFGAAIINPGVEGLLLRQGFSRRSEPVPDELGDDGDMEVLSRHFLVS